MLYRPDSWYCYWMDDVRGDDMSDGPTTWDLMQRYNLPAPGSTIIFTRTPGASYSRVGEAYRVGWSKHSNYVSLQRVETGSCTHDGFSAWQYAEWEHADGKGGKY